MLDDAAVTDSEILTEAQERLKLAIEAETVNRKDALDDLNFGAGNQWETRVKQDRDTENRPCLTVNITDAMVRRVSNACRENRPRIKVHPVSDGADKQTANVIDGLIRHIEYASSADVAYDAAIESAIRGGWGYIRVSADYVDDKSFDQDLKIERVRNPFTVYPDPSSQAPDGSDYEWCIVSEMMGRQEYKARFGQIDSGGWQYLGAGDNLSDWSNKEQIRVAEYFRIERKADKLLKLSTGKSILKSQLVKEAQALMAQEGVTIVDERKTVTRQVCWYLLNHARILDQRILPGKYIPIVPVYGRELDLNGKILRKGMIRDMKDPARIFNFAETAKAETYGLQPRAPWLGPEGFMSGKESAWRDANRKPIVALEYKPTLNPDGSVAPPPQRQMPPPVADGFKEWSESAQSNFLAVAGMPNEPGADAKGEVVSGIALQKRQGLSDISHYDFYDNFTRSQRQVGRIIVDLIPSYYDAPRIVRIVGDDGTPSSVQLNEQTADHVKNDMTVGRYEIVIDSGPSYQTKREESRAFQIELLKGPLGEMIAQNAGDVVVRGFDFHNSDKIADRIQSSIPAAQTDPQSDLPEKAQVMIAGLQAQLKQLGQKNLALELEIQAKHGLEKIKQDAETDRAHLAATTKVHDTDTRSKTSIDVAHIQAVTAHNTAEIHAATQLLNTNTEAAHDRAAAREIIDQGTEASK